MKKAAFQRTRPLSKKSQNLEIGENPITITVKDRNETQSKISTYFWKVGACENRLPFFIVTAYFFLSSFCIKS